MQAVIFAILALITIGAALMVVTSQNLLRSALWLILAFFGIAGIFILLQAEFLAVTQILIYVGAIAMLIIFAVMLTRGLMDPKQPKFNDQWGVVGGFAALLFVVLAFLVTRIQWPVAGVDAATDGAADVISQLGQNFVGPYVIPFEVASVLLVVAMIGAIIIARERE